MDEKTPQQNSPPEKKPRLVTRILLFLIALAMVLTAVALVAFRNTLNLDAVKRWFTYRALVLSDSGQAEAFHYDGEVSDAFAVLDGDLLVCSGNAISLYSGSGTRYVRCSVNLKDPVVSRSGSRAVVYGAGEGSLYVLGQRELIWSAEDLGCILSAHLNRQGMLTVVTQQSGYRGAVTVYSSACRPLVTVGITSAYVMDAALSDDGRTLAIVTVGQSSGSFTSTLSLYTVNTASGSAGESADFIPDRTVELGDSVVLDLLHSEQCVLAVGDRGLSVTDHEGTVSWCDWSDRYLKLYDLGGSGFAVALLGLHRAGTQATLQVMDETGAVTGSLELTEQVLSLSAAGNYLAVLTGDRLDIYTSDLAPVSTLEGTEGARKVVLMQDGSAILISPDNARFYVP